VADIDTSHTEIRVYTFGTFSVERLITNSSPSERPRYEKIAKEEWRSRGPAIALLKLLLCRTSRRISRDTVMDTLWPETNVENASKSLDVATSILRSVLRVDDRKSLLIKTHSSDAGILALPDQRKLWVDADAFESYLAQASKAESQGQDPLPFLEAAQELVKGEFLEDDIYEDWTQNRRQAIDAARRRMTHHLADLYTRRELFDQSESLLQTLLIENPTDEDALNRLMMLLSRQDRRQEAINLYKRTAKVLQEEHQRKPASRTRELAERIYKEPVNIEKNVLLYTPASKRHSDAIDKLIVGQGQQPSEETTQSWLLATLSDLTHLIDAGWTVSDILAALQTTLSGLTIVSPSTRQHFLRLAGGAILGKQSSLVVDSAPANAWELAAALNSSNATSWAIFNTSPTSSVLVAGQVQLQMLQQLHEHLPSQVRPFMYSGVYRLIGAAHFFQARYAEALKAHNQSYFAALEAGDLWNRAESLSWQGGVWKACGQQEEAIRLAEEALRLTNNNSSSHVQALRARLFAHIAESAALLNQRDIALEKLEASAELAHQLDANEEFDASTLLQYQATCALYLSDTENATTYFHQALNTLKPNQTLQRAYTAQFLGQAYLKLDRLKEALDAFRLALPSIMSIQSLMLSSSFIEDVQKLHAQYPNNSAVEAFVEETLRQIKPTVQIIVPRYLEAKL